jgi:hypothetical protein
MLLKLFSNTRQHAPPNEVGARMKPQLSFFARDKQAIVHLGLTVVCVLLAVLAS